ncbi:MAG: hypothetical protein JNL10_09135 [Verrucomicrobiales bacterium]|nr:hypothetical protein [Verrucomicrobiales bacterium]
MDGQTVDGFFGEETPDALTVRFAGGTQQVIPVRSIRSAGYIDGQSVMPEGLLEGLSEDQVIDLVRYVRSIP